MGVIADILWYDIPNHAPYAELGDYIVMPNHIHGILILNNPGGMDLQGMNAQPQSTPSNMAALSPKSNSISAIVRSYKSAVTKHANRLGIDNGWQPRFLDHIIRYDAEYQRISDYIVNNPANWRGDKFNAK